MYFKSSSVNLVRIAALLVALAGCGLARSVEEPPNVVVILADDLGYGDVSCYGGAEGYSTPEIDRMASEGIRFTGFYSASGVCTPSRAALLTGRYMSRWSNSGGVYFPKSKDGMPLSEVTIAEVLQNEGYATALVGKWHLGHRPGFQPLEQGFDVFYGIPYSNDMTQDGEMPLAEGVVFREGMSLEEYKDYQPQNLDGGNAPYHRYKNMVPLVYGTEVIEWPADQTSLTKRYTERAVGFIEKNRERPFFLYLAHSMPHIPIYASKEFSGRTERGLYGDVIEELDWSVGQVLQCLRKNGLEENTLVIFTSDNGPWLTMGENGGSAGPLRDGKGSNYEGGQRVPGVFWWPGRIPSGGSSDFVGSSLDLLPTIAGLAGAELPDDRELDGIDLLPALIGRVGPDRTGFVYGGEQAIRIGEWKYRTGRKYGGWSGMPKNIENPFVEQLFNLEKDMGEGENLIDRYPEKAVQMKKQLQRLKREIRKDTK